MVEEKAMTDQSLDLNDKLRVGVGEALELVLVQIHDEEFICGSELHCHLGELLVEVAGVPASFLHIVGETERENKSVQKRNKLSLL